VGWMYGCERPEVATRTSFWSLFRAMSPECRAKCREASTEVTEAVDRVVDCNGVRLRL
jgi:hypothetical protein